MNDSSLTQRFRINALHGNDVGVLVCEGTGISISPILFMQAVCPVPVPSPLFVKWKRTASPPKPFRQSRTLPLIYDECGRVPPWPYYLHLFAPQLPAARSFEQESALQDWSFPVRMIGMVVIFDQKYDVPLSQVLLNWLIHGIKPATPKKNPSLEWARAQELPFVIAALGYEDTPPAEYQFRNLYGLAADIPVVPGPALRDERQMGPKRQGVQASSSMFSSVFEPHKLAFDGDHARTVLDALYQLIQRKG